MRRASLFYPILLLVCWSILIVGGTYAVVDTTVRQQLATRFASTRGKIVLSQVGRGPILRRGVEMAYNYTVNGVEYTGHRYRYDDHNMALAWDSTIKAHPRWSYETIYYNPANPSDSVVQPGIDGSDLLLLLFAVPLLVITGTLWRGLISHIRDGAQAGSAGGVPISKRSGEVRVGMKETALFGAVCYGVAAGAFVASFPLVITSGFAPTLHAMRLAWLLVFLSGIGAFMWRLLRKLSGSDELRFSTTSETVILPATAGRFQPFSIGRKQISGVTIQRRTIKSPSGTHFSYLPALSTVGAGNGPLKLVTWGWSEDRARAFCRWLSEELGVEFKGIEDESPKLAEKSLPASTAGRVSGSPI